MRVNAPAYWDNASRLWGITRYADVMEISKRPELFCSSGSSRPDAPPLPSMINLDDPAHRQPDYLRTKPGCLDSQRWNRVGSGHICFHYAFHSSERRHL